MISKKRGISTVVATMLLILITLAAISIVISVVMPFVKNSLDSTGCFKFRDYYIFDESLGYSCHDEINGRYIMSVRVRTDDSEGDKIKGLGIRFLSDTKADILSVKEGVFIPNLEMFEGGSIVIPSSGGKYKIASYNYTSNEIYDKAEIYPIFEDGRICDKSDSIKISKCN